MKINDIKVLFLLIFIGLIITSCKTNSLPKVLHPEYESYHFSEQKGYIVEFDLSHDSIKPKSVIINNIIQDINPESKINLHYKINVIAQTTNILNYKVKLMNSENGIVFKTDSTDIFKAVNFKLKTK